MMTSEAKHVLNKPENLVLESIKGLCYANPHLQVLEKDKVIYYANVDAMAAHQVTLISGGGSGHEPGFAGMIGENGLAANVCGHVFASPSSSQVLAAIERVQSPHGTLVVILNYTGDCLNFGLAVERAKARGIKVDLIAVGDDVSVGRKKGAKVGRRGMAATALVIKMAGALASQGASLEKVREITQYIKDRSATLGVAFNHCHVPGTATTTITPLGAHEIELGMGIHNESGCLKTSMMPGKSLVDKMMTILLDKGSDRRFLDLNKKSRVVLMINNLGGLPVIELNLVVKETVEYLLAYEVVLERVYVGSFVTSLNMPGFSVSVLVVDQDEHLALLDLPARVAGWPCMAAQTFSTQICGDIDATKTIKKLSSHDASVGKVDPKILEAAIRGATDAVIQAEPRITEYDTILGDGDCGQTLKSAALAIQESLDQYDLTSPASTCLSISETIEQTAGGTSSAIYCIFLNALAGGLLNQTPIAAAHYALMTLKSYTKARVGDRTLMDTLCPFVETLYNTENLQEALSAAREGADSTSGLTAQVGRASYLSNEQVLKSGVPDAGAFGLAELLNGMVEHIPK